MAKALMISRTTLRRRLLEANVSFGNYSDICDSDLDVIVTPASHVISGRLVESYFVMLSSIS